jgi:hypothetical protein
MTGTITINGKKIPVARILDVIQQRNPRSYDELLGIARALALTLTEVSDTVNLMDAIVSDLDMYDNSDEIVRFIAASSLNSTQKVLAAWQVARIMNYLETPRAGGAALLPGLEADIEAISNDLPAYKMYDFQSLDQMQQAVAEAYFILQTDERAMRFRLVEDVLKRPDYAPTVKAYFTALLVAENDSSNRMFFEVLEEAVKEARRAAAAQAG